MIEFIRRLSRDRFAKRVQRAIAAKGGPNDFVYDRASFMLKRPNSTAFLGNVYEAFQQARGEQRIKVFENYVSVFAQQSDAKDATFSELESKLTAAVRESAFLAALAGPGWGLDKASDPLQLPAHEPISAWFSRCLVIDYPTHVAVVNEKHLKDWGVTFEEAYLIGLHKLSDATLPKFRLENGYYVGGWDDDYDSSRILLPSLFDDLPLAGNPIIVIPNRLTLLVAGESDHAAIRAMLATAETIVREKPKPQNAAPLIIRDGQLSDYEVDASSPIFHEVQRARKVSALLTYEDQKANLDRHYKKVGKDLFVATYTLNQAQDGHYASFSLWSQGIPTLLPETDEVIFFDPNKPEANRIVARVPWSRVIAVVGELTFDTGMFPRRHFVSKFPTHEQLAALQCPP
jgi:hypothetical protein